MRGLRVVGSSLRKFFGVDRVVGLGMLVGLVLVSVVDPYPIEFVRAKTFDMYQRFRPRVVTERPVTIVDIDEASLQEIGQWPWPRTTLATLVGTLADAGASVIGFDVVFAEPDRMNPDQVAAKTYGLDGETQNRLRALASNDFLLAYAFHQTRVRFKAGNREEETGRVVLGQIAVLAEDSVVTFNSVRDPPPVKSVSWRGGSKDAPAPNGFLPPFEALVRNIPVLEGAAAGHGIFTLLAEPDRTVRRVPTFLVRGDAFFPSLPIEILRVAMLQETSVLITGSHGVEEVRISNPQGGFFSIPTDGQGRVWPYFSTHDPARFLPARDVLNGVAHPSRVAGRIVIIGSSAGGLRDLHGTPVGQPMAGIEIHAQFLETVLNGEFLSRPEINRYLELGLLLLTGALVIALVPWVGAKWTMALFLVLAGGMGALSWHQFVQSRELLDVTFSVISTLLIYVAMTYLGFSRAEVEKRQIRSAFAHYISPTMVERLADDPSQLKLGGEKCEMTMLFCDVRGFTSISEAFKDYPEGLTKLVNQLLTPLTRVVLDHRGTVDKYMGDCVMAFWNAPLSDAEHARHACQAALAMIAEMGPLNERLMNAADPRERPPMELRVGVGVNSGEVVVGNMGSDQRFEYSVLGDAVNLASRLEGQCKTYGVECVIGPTTEAVIKDFATLELDLIRVRGKQEAVAIHALLGDAEVAGTDAFKVLKEAHEAMIGCYRAQEWPQARERLAQCRRRMGGLKVGALYDLYAARIDACERLPPDAGWDGVSVAVSK